MRARQAVLLTPLECAVPNSILYSIYNAFRNSLECAIPCISPATPLECAVPKKRGWGPSPDSGARNSPLLTCHHILFPIRNGYALPAAMGAAAKRACRLQERSSCVVTQLSAGGGGGGASVAPLNFRMCIPCLPGPPCVTL